MILGFYRRPVGVLTLYNRSPELFWWSSQQNNRVIKGSGMSHHVLCFAIRRAQATDQPEPEESKRVWVEIAGRKWG